MYSLAYVTTVAYNYWKTGRYESESSQKDESRAKQADFQQAGYEATASFVIDLQPFDYMFVCLLRSSNSFGKIFPNTLILSPRSNYWDLLLIFSVWVVLALLSHCSCKYLHSDVSYLYCCDADARSLKVQIVVLDDRSPFEVWRFLFGEGMIVKNVCQTNLCGNKDNNNTNFNVTSTKFRCWLW